MARIEFLPREADWWRSEEKDVTPSRWWKLMTAEQRLRAAAALWGDDEATNDQMQAALRIAQQMKLRPKTVSGLDGDRKARYLASVPDLPEDLAARLLVLYHLAAQRPMMGAFLDVLGIPHENGVIQDDTVTPDPAKTTAAVAAIAREYPGRTSRSISTRSCGRIRRRGGCCGECPRSARLLQADDAPLGRAETAHDERAPGRGGDAQITPADRARAAIFFARVRCGMSIIWPFQAKAPAPFRACSSKAAMRASASSASARDGVNSRLMTSIWFGWIEILPGEGHRDALPALAREALDVRDVGVDGVDGFHARGRRGHRAHHARVAGNVQVAALVVAHARQAHRGPEVLDAPRDRDDPRARRGDLADVEQALRRLGGDGDEPGGADGQPVAGLEPLEQRRPRDARPRRGAAWA